MGATVFAFNQWCAYTLQRCTPDALLFFPCLSLCSALSLHDVVSSCLCLSAVLWNLRIEMFWKSKLGKMWRRRRGKGLKNKMRRKMDDEEEEGTHRYCIYSGFKHTRAHTHWITRRFLCNRARRWYLGATTMVLESDSSGLTPSLTHNQLFQSESYYSPPPLFFLHSCSNYTNHI